MQSTKGKVPFVKKNHRLIVAVLLFWIATPGSGLAQGKPSNPSLPDQINALQNQVNQQQFQINQLLEQAAPPIEILVREVARGTYEADGTARLGDNYFAGAFESSGASREFRNFFAFNLTVILETLGIPPLQPCGATIVSGLFNVVNPQNGFVSDSDTETYSLNRAGLFFGDEGLDKTVELIGGLLGPAGFTDLADGPGYGSYVASATVGNVLVIPLSPRAIYDMNVRLQSPADAGTNSRFFAIGGSISTLNDLVDTEGLFAGSSKTNPPPTANGLILEVKKTQCPTS